MAILIWVCDIVYATFSAVCKYAKMMHVCIYVCVCIYVFVCMSGYVGGCTQVHSACLSVHVQGFAQCGCVCLLNVCKHERVCQGACVTRCCLNVTQGIGSWLCCRLKPHTAFFSNKPIQMGKQLQQKSLGIPLLALCLHSHIHPAAISKKLWTIVQFKK